MHPQNQTILIIEDNSGKWKVLQAAMRLFLPLVKIIWLTSSQSALAYLDACAAMDGSLPNLILLDLYIPQREGGVQLLETLKSKEKGYQSVPVIVLSHHNVQADMLLTYQLGGASYLVMPTDFNQWQELVKILKQYQ